ncbi:MAG: transcriptional regulator [Rhizobacter sp.]|nr:transcriptional regulator [Ferruginibacter sp.]
MPLFSIGQNTIGLPDVINYSKQSYSGGLQSWDCTQDKNGIIYFANNEGLLSFDGRYWKIYPLPNRTIVRSVKLGNDNRIYVGGQDELGYFSPSPNGRLLYHSLVNLIPEKDHSFGDVWDIVALNKDVFFRSPNKIFRFTNETVASFASPAEWSFMGAFNSKLYAHDYSKGLMVFKNDSWNPVDNDILPLNDPVTSIVPQNDDSALVTTLKKGLYWLTATGLSKLNSSNDGLFQNERIYAATGISNNRIALATSTNGIYIIDRQGNIIQRFSKTEGLQNKNVLSIFLDAQSNLWLGLDNGIDLIAYNSAIKQINPLQQDGSGYTTLIYKDHLYAGTSGGLFNVPLHNMEDMSFSMGSFTAVENTRGQTWKLAEVNNKLLLGHHDGAYLVEGNSARQISANLGFWNFVPLSNTFPATAMVAGNYKGLKLFSYQNDAFVPQVDIPNFKESSRFVAIDKQDNIWVSQPYHGVYRIFKKPDGTYTNTTYTDKNGLPAALNNHVYKIKNEVLVATEKGVYSYNAPKDLFEPALFYKKLLGEQSIRYLKEDTEGNIWFIHDKSLGVIDLTGKEPATIYIPELSTKLLSGFEFIYPVDNNNIFLGAEKGFFHINYANYKKNVPELKAQVRLVRIIDKTDSLLFGGYFNDVNDPQKQSGNAIPSIRHSWKTIRFEFTASLFGYQSNLEYSFRLKGFDDSWSEYTKKTEKEYTNLPAGKYTFEVKARNNFGKESPIASYVINILPPWYVNTWAKTIYGLIFISGLYFLYRWLKKKFRLQRAKYEEEQKRLLYIHELEINKNESEMVALRNEKLEAEINYKNSELASSAMHLVKKGELLTKVKTELSQVMKGMENPQAVAELKKMIRTLSDDDNMDKEWENFTKHFDKVHSDFIVGLKEKHATITGNEVKLCAYLRMNLSTKEIAQLMNISVRGVEISRYRLRKKLAISSDMNLFDYLINIQSKN